MQTPRVFVGSSSEGLPIARAVFNHLRHATKARLWTHQLFLPGRYPLEVLEAELKTSDFAILVASPDDEVVKRGMRLSAMRDNLLLEFGLFSGVLGRRRTFFLCPNTPQVALPSDLLGIIPATYDAGRATGAEDEQAAAVQVACLEISRVIREEWTSILCSRAEHLKALNASQEAQAVRRLYAVITRFRDTLVVVQRDAFAAFTNRPAFEQVKNRAADELAKITESCAADARAAGVEKELELLRFVTNEALLDLPFPQELAVGGEAGRRHAVEMGMQALDTFLGGRDPIRHVQDEAETEIRDRLSGLRHRYAEWWDRHASILRGATSRMQDALFAALVTLVGEKS